MRPRYLRAGRLLPDARSEALTDRWIRIEGGVITAIEAAPPAGEDEVVDLSGAIVMPGFCVAHTHIDYGEFAGHGDGLGFVPWIQALNQRKFRGQIGPEDYLRGARRSCEELLKSGVTCIGEASDPGTSAAGALIESGLKAVVFQEEFSPHPAGAPAALARLDEKLQALEELTEGTAVRVGISPHAPYTVAPPLFEGMVTRARRRGMPLSIHLAESEDEVAFVCDGAGEIADAWRKRDIPVEARGVSPYRFVADQGWLDGPGPVLLVHGVQLEPADIADLARRPHVSVVHCPRSNARLGVGIAPVRALLDAGVRVLLGTDGACSADRLDPFEEMRAAVWMARARERRADALTAREALEMAWAGHQVLGFGPGRVEVGAPADLCVVRDQGVEGVDVATEVVMLAGRGDLVGVELSGDWLQLECLPTPSGR